MIVRLVNAAASTLCLLTASFFSQAMVAQESAVFSGPQVGEKLPPLKVTVVYGRSAQQTVDYVQQAARRPALIVVVNGTNRPAASVTRCLMNYSEMLGEKLFAAVVYLDGDVSAAEQYLRQAPAWWSVGPSVGISVDGAEGPGSYGFNRNVNVTVLVADKNQVTANFSLVQPSLTDIPGILTQVAKLTGARVPTIAEVEFLSMPTHKPPHVAWPSAPADPKMREKICDALAATDSKQADAAAHALLQYVGDDKARQSILGNLAAAILEGRGKENVRDLPINPFLRDWQTKFATQDRKRSP